MGHYLGWAGRHVAPSAAMADDRKFKPFVAGTLAWYAGAAMVLIAALALQALAQRLPPWLAWALIGLALKPLLAWRMLRSEALAVEAALGESLDAGRVRAWPRLVSRDVRALTESEVRESAIESLAENLNDSVVAPIFWFVLFGLPGAAVYRFANTADAMWGYRGERGGRNWTWAGKWAARADDVLSWAAGAHHGGAACVGRAALAAWVAAPGAHDAIAQQRLADGGDGVVAWRAAGQARRVCAERHRAHARGRGFASCRAPRRPRSDRCGARRFGGDRLPS